MPPGGSPPYPGFGDLQDRSPGARNHSFEVFRRYFNARNRASAGHSRLDGARDVEVFRCVIVSGFRTPQDLVENHRAGCHLAVFRGLGRQSYVLRFRRPGLGRRRQSGTAQRPERGTHRRRHHPGNRDHVGWRGWTGTTGNLGNTVGPDTETSNTGAGGGARTATISEPGAERDLYRRQWRQRRRWRRFECTRRRWRRRI